MNDTTETAGHECGQPEPQCLCAHCQKPFAPGCRNASRQKFCLRPTCVADRARLRNRLWYAEKRKDPKFCQTEAVRCRKAMAQIRQRRKMTAATPAVPTSPPLPVPSTAPPPTADESAFALGLLAHFLDTDNLETVLAGRAELEQRGRRIAAASAARCAVASG
jgi:hypothetical protein